jgi:hypothetical protein
MDAKTAATPGATTTEGTVIYCTTPGTDTITTQTVNTNRTDVQEVQTLTFYNSGVATNPTAATFIITFAGEACDASAHGAVNADIENDCNTNANLAGLDVAINGAGTAAVLTFAAATGDVPLVTCTGAGLYGGAGGTCTAVETTKGVSGVTFDFIDDDLTNNSFVTIKTVKDRQSGADSTAGLPVLTTWYQRWTYDSTDNFATGTALANQGQTEAAFETANAAIANLTTDVALTYRTGATTSGQSHFSVGG